MGKVAYLFGAGASALCVPVVEKLPGELRQFCQTVAANKNSSETKDHWVSKANVGLTWSMVEEEFIIELEKIIHECENHASIDTYAKKLFITEDPSYDRLKAILSCFFIYIQFVNKTDPRYDTFFASIIADKALNSWVR